MADERSVGREWFARVRWQIQDLLNRLDDAPAPKEDLRKRIDRLEANGKVPEMTARLLHLILTARNKAEYENRVYTGAEAKQLLSAWESVRDGDRPGWNDGSGSGSPVMKAVDKPIAATGAGATFACPIPGCRKIFHSSRGGWDAHVASYAKHPGWYPDVIDGELRKERFRQDYRDWFA